MRLAFLFALLVLFLAGYLYVRLVLPADRDRPAPVERYVARREIEPPIRRQPSVRIDRELLSQVRDATRVERLVREPEPYAHLLTQARRLTPGDMEALGIRPLDFDAVFADPAKFRGDPFRVKGTLVDLEVVRGRVWQEVRGTLRDREGRLVAFTVLEDPKVRPGDVVRLDGFFFKIAAVEVEPGRYEDAPLLVGKRLVRSFFPIERVESLEEIAWDEVRDFDATEMIRLPEDVIFKVLAWVRGLDEEKRRALSAPEVDYAELRRHPDRYRGKVIRILARYVPGLEWERKLGPNGENPLEVEAFHEGILALPGNRLIRWVALEPFPKQFLDRTRLFYVTAVFIKNYAWENEKGEILSGPLVVPVRVDPFELPGSEVIEGVARWIGGTVLALLVLFFVLAVRDARDARRFRREYLRRKRQRLQQRALDDSTAMRRSERDGAPDSRKA